MDDTNRSTLSGLSESEAREFHSIFITTFIIFTVVAVIAHFLAWQWRPWLPGPGGYAAVVKDTYETTLAAVGAAFNA